MKGTRLVKFQAIFFDLFNTLLHFDFSLLPQVEFQGGLLPTTSVEVYRQLSESMDPSFSYPTFLEEFQESREIVTQLEEPGASGILLSEALSDSLQAVKCSRQIDSEVHRQGPHG